MRILIMAPVVLSLLAAGCASLSWERPNTDQAALNAVLRDCERQARAQAPRLSASAGSSAAAPMTPYGAARSDRSGYREVAGR